jgi:hypothetical protein
MVTRGRKFCQCIKAVKKTLKLRKGLSPNKEAAAIAICVKSMLHTKGRTLKRFSCLGKKPKFITQKRKVSK